MTNPDPQDLFDLQCLLDSLEQTENGARVVSYGPRDDTDGTKVLTIWTDDSEEYGYPDVIERIASWLKGLPEKPPDETAEPLDPMRGVEFPFAENH